MSQKKPDLDVIYTTNLDFIVILEIRDIWLALPMSLQVLNTEFWRGTTEVKASAKLS